MQKLVIVIFLLNSLRCFAAHEMYFENVMILPVKKDLQKTFDVSVYISEKSPWSELEIQERLTSANQIFSTCQIGIRHVYLHSWRPSNPLLRVDDYKSDQKYYDGIRHASVQSKKVTSLQLYYFENYLESFTSGPSLPLALYPDKKVEPVAFNSAWFPFESAQRQKPLGEPRYNEEAHEIGHILLQSGHDHSGLSNIMANDSKLREPRFSKDQCDEIKANLILNEEPSQEFYSIFATYYQKYSRDFYMTDWCSRNTWNLSQKIDELYGLVDHKAFTIDVVHKNKGQSFYPLNSRRTDLGWKFHTFLVIDGFVLDLDFGKIPQIVKIEEYLEIMFGRSLNDLQFLMRSPLDSPGFSYLDILKNLESHGQVILNSRELIERIHDDSLISK